MSLPVGSYLHQEVFDWVVMGDLSAPFGLVLDRLSAVMCLVVTGVGGLIHLYSTGYMGHDHAFARYFAYLNLFTFAMLILVMGANILLMFVGGKAWASAPTSSSASGTRMKQKPLPGKRPLS